jgi:alcohol dehydrogenase, propanol-preferring
MVADGVFGTELPCTASHEGAGTVVAMGKDVKDWKVGDRCMVALKPHLCGKCSSCTGPNADEKRHYCPNAGKTPGVTGDGAFAEYMTADSEESSKIPDVVTFETAAPLACAGRTVYHAVAQARLKKDQWISIVGSGGGLGHLGIQFAKARGLRIVAVDASDKGIQMSKEMGANVVLDARDGKEKVVKQVMDKTGNGCDATINLSDADPAAALAAAITRMHSHILQIAQVRGSNADRRKGS